MAFVACGFVILKGLKGIIRQEIRLKRRHEIGKRAVCTEIFLIAIGGFVITLLELTLQNPTAFSH